MGKVKNPRPMTRVENLLKSIAILSEDSQIDKLVDEALGIIHPRDKRTGKADPSQRKRKPAKRKPAASS